MIKKEFIEFYAKENGIQDLKIAKEEVEKFLETLKAAFTNEKEIIFRGFGSFEVRKTKERKIVDPKDSSKTIHAKPRKYIKFKVSKKIEEELAE